jgi:hypothetical protein
MSSCIVCFDGYENKTLDIKREPYEASEKFCRYVNGPWLIARNVQIQRGCQTHAMLTACEWCGVITYIPIPPRGNPFLCASCRQEMARDFGYELWQSNDWE